MPALPRPAKPALVHGRAQAWDALQRLHEASGPQLVFALGRRRVGKSFLLSRFLREVGGIYFQATRGTESEQRAELCRVIGERVGDPALARGQGFARWDTLFEYLGERASGAPLWLVLDEFPYLAAAAPALPSILQRAWDHTWPQTSLRVVLCGSYVSAMRRLEQADQPLYGRRTARLHLAPFRFDEAGAFMQPWGPRDRFLAWATFGHLPGHLARLDPDRDVADNIARQLLDPMGPLVDEAQHALDTFLPQSRPHHSILQAIAGGDRTWSRITSRVGQTGGSLQRPLHWLEEMDLVERVVPMSARPLSRRTKRAYYRITDPYLMFWYRFVAPLLRGGSLGLIPAEQLWSEVVEPRLGEHLGGVFEDTCREFVRHSDRLPLQPLRVGRWWSPSYDDELDIVALDARGHLLCAECKWGEVSTRHLETLRRRARRLAAELGAPRTHLALFTGRDAPAADLEPAIDAGEVQCFTLADLASP